MEAAIVESHRSERSLILTGLEMFDRIDGELVGSRDQMQLYKGKKQFSIREQLAEVPTTVVPGAMQDAVLAFVAQLLGFDTSVFDPASSLAIYGLDSLSAVSCQYWFHRELSIDVAVTAVLNACINLGTDQASLFEVTFIVVYI
ncbi:hypothetical protein MMC32_008209 [Xylographa parallela]|nr:hypothetical protein [Xylographa parallela]